MSTAAAAQDLALLQRAVHQLKSSSAIVAALPLANLCKQFEAAIHTIKTDDWQAWVQNIEAEFARVQTALEKELQN